MKELKSFFYGNTSFFFECAKWYFECGHDINCLVTSNASAGQWAEEELIDLFQKSLPEEMLKEKNLVIVIDDTEKALDLLKKGVRVLFNVSSSEGKTLISEEWFLGSDMKNLDLFSFKEFSPEVAAGRIEQYADILSKLSRQELSVVKCREIFESEIPFKQKKFFGNSLIKSFLSRYLDQPEISLYTYESLIKNPNHRIGTYVQTVVEKYTGNMEGSLSCVTPDHTNPIEEIRYVNFLWNWKESRKIQKLEAYIYYDEGSSSFKISACSKEYVEDFLRSFKFFLSQIKHTPDILLRTLKVLSPKQEQKILDEFNDTHKNFQTLETIPQEFEKIVENWGEKTAIVSEEGSLTYETLNERANQMAHYLNQKISENSKAPVGILAQDNFLKIVAMLGVLKSGRPYVPLDERYPKERCRDILNDSSAQCVITDRGVEVSEYCDFDKIIEVKSFDVLEKFSIQNPEPPLKSADSAYIIYTSGTTGKPKGVKIKHESLLNVIASEIDICTISPSSRIIQVASLGFDAAGWDIYGALLSGAELHMVSGDVRLSPEALGEKVKDNSITHLTITPQVLRLMGEKNLKSLENLVVMGDLSDRGLLSKYSKSCRVFNGYGPTEATIGCTMHKYKSGDTGALIGRPMHNYKILILDSHKNLSPVGVPGEMYVSGIGLSEGYQKREDLTKEKFVLNPYFREGVDKSHFKKLYKTGDIAKWNENGEILFSGRRDNQVKIRGVRIELEEIESILNSIEPIQQSAVAARCRNDSKFLEVYYTLRQHQKDGIDLKKNLRDILEKYLPPSAVPAAYVKLDKMPMTPNGKVDKKRLPKPKKEDLILSTYITPENEFETIVCQNIENILDTKNVGMEDDFFHLGGHSLSATVLSSKLRELGYSCTPKIIFENSKVRDLCFALSRIASKEPARDKISKCEGNTSPLSFSQSRLWFVSHNTGQSLAYNLPIALKIEGRIDKEKLEKALKKVVARHSILRTIFKDCKGIPFQEVLENYEVKLENLACSKEDLQLLIKSYLDKPFDLERSPPQKYLLFKLDETQHVFFILKHNIITDAWSESLFLQDLSFFYNSPDSLSIHNRAYEYRDISEYKNKSLTKESVRGDLHYWKNHLEGFEELDFPLDKKRPHMMTYDGKRELYQIGKNTMKQIRNICISRGVTPFTFYYTALSILMHKVTGQEDIVIGTALAGRNDEESQKSLGFFIETLPLRCNVSTNISFSTLLSKSKEVLNNLQEHSAAPFEWIVDEVNPTRHLNKAPIFQHMVVFQNANEEFSLNLGNCKSNNMMVKRTKSMFDTTWNISETHDGIVVELDYSTEIFESGTIERVLRSFEYVLKQLIDNIDIKIEDISAISSFEKEKLLSNADFRDDHIMGPMHVVKAFKKKALENPQKVAFIFSDQHITYATLDQDSDIIKNYLIHSLPEKNNLVAVFMEKSIDFISTLLGVLKSGNSYLILDPNYPTERLNYILNDSKSEIVLCSARTVKLLDGKNNVVPIHKILEKELVKQSKGPSFNQDERAYVLYTSGSTGDPKGMQISHKNIMNIVYDFYKSLQLGDNELLLSVTNPTFDIFQIELYIPLLCGFPLYLTDDKTASDPVAVFKAYERLNPTIMQATPSLWSTIARHLPSNPNFKILCGGESLPKDLAESLLKCTSNLYNVYGPTETTVWSTLSRVTNSENITIGKPIANTSCYVMNDKNHLMPRGSYGELCVGGWGVGLGYLFRDKLNREKFIENPFKNRYEDPILYKTGDIVRLNSDNDLQFSGRNDGQVKLRGHRIELMEIENTLISHPSIEKAAVLLTSVQGYDAIVSFYKFYKEAEHISADEIKEYLSSKLPPIMIPSFIQKLLEFPLTSSGKIDRKKLPNIDKITAMRDKKLSEAKTPVQKWLKETWEKVIGINDIGVDDSFFMVGGNSLHVPQIVSQINAKYFTELTIRNFIENATILELSNLIAISNQEK